MNQPGGDVAQLGAGRDDDRPFALATRNRSGFTAPEQLVELFPLGGIEHRRQGAPVHNPALRDFRLVDASRFCDFGALLVGERRFFDAGVRILLAQPLHHNIQSALRLIAHDKTSRPHRHGAVPASRTAPPTARNSHA